jgi:hypothetical protein
MKQEIVLINRDGKEEARLPMIPHRMPGNAWIAFGGRWWGFGVGKLGGEQHYYEVLPEPQPEPEPIL